MDNIKELLSLGKQSFDRKQYADAERYLKQVIQKQPQYADVQNMLGVIVHLKGEFEAAISYFKKALSINPRYTEALLNLVVLYNDLGEYKEAKKLYESLKNPRTSKQGDIEPVLRGKLSNLHADIGDIYRSIGLHGMAIEEYRKALHLNPDYHDIRTKLGQALREHHQLTDSKKELTWVLQRNTQYAPARIQLGVTFYSMGKEKEAKKEWQTVLQHDAENAYAQMYLRLCEAVSSPRRSTGKAATKKALPLPRNLKKKDDHVGKTNH